MLAATLVGGTDRHNRKFVRGLRSIGVDVKHVYPTPDKPRTVEGTVLVIGPHHSALQLNDLDGKIMIPWSVTKAKEILEQRGLLSTKRTGGRQAKWTDEELWDAHLLKQEGKSLKKVLQSRAGWRKRSESGLRHMLKTHLPRIIADKEAEEALRQLAERGTSDWEAMAIELDGQLTEVNKKVVRVEEENRVLRSTNKELNEQVGALIRDKKGLTGELRAKKEGTRDAEGKLDKISKAAAERVQKFIKEAKEKNLKQKIAELREHIKGLVAEHRDALEDLEDERDTLKAQLEDQNKGADFKAGVRKGIELGKKAAESDDLSLLLDLL